MTLLSPSDHKTSFRPIRSAHRATFPVVVLFAVLTGPVVLAQQPSTTGLQKRLLAQSPTDLAKKSRALGDASRGAIVFHQVSVGCAKCHSVGEDDNDSLGPNLARLGTVAPNDDAYIVRSILDPSSEVRKGYETITVLKTDGKVLSGLKIKSDENGVVLRDPSTGSATTIKDDEIEEVSPSKISIMPESITAGMTGEQPFYDLVRYVIELRDGGVERAKQLQPPKSLIAFTLPEYESKVDHAGLIRSLDQEAMNRGKAIYDRLCVNCHGTKDKPGSLPTALRFAEGKFRVGSDPYSMYHTLTHGFGLMVPQTWMVPRQKYDVVHYIRQTFVRRHNPGQFREVDEEYLSGLPVGDTFGPEPREFSPWSDMDYGPWMFNTVEVGKGGSNIAYKGLAVRLDPGPGGVARGNQWMLFDHDTMRVAAAWSRNAAASENSSEHGFIDWQGIHFDGRHQAHPHAVGDIAFSNPSGPGWANPGTGKFDDDSRVLGRDDRRYGPLPRDWAKYRGAFQTGESIAVSYSVGDMSVLESFGQIESAAQGSNLTTENSGDESRAESPAHPGFVRLMRLGPSCQKQIVSVATDPDETAELTEIDGGAAVFSTPNSPAQADSNSQPSPVLAGKFDGSGWLEIKDAEEFDTAKSDFTITARVRTDSDGVVFTRTLPKEKWVPNGTMLFIRGGRLCYDIGWVGVVATKKRIANDRWHDIALVWKRQGEQVRLYIDGKIAGSGSLSPKDSLSDAVLRIGYGTENFPGTSRFDGSIEDVRFYRLALSTEQIKSPPAKSDALLGRWLSNHDMGPEVTVVKDSQVIAKRQTRLLSGIAGDTEGMTWRQHDNRLCVEIPPSERERRLAIWTKRIDVGRSVAGQSVPDNSPAEGMKSVANRLTASLSDQAKLLLDAADWSQSLDRQSKPLWPEVLKSNIQTYSHTGSGDDRHDGGSGFEVDVLSAPESNPWLARLRFSGLDFFPGGDSMAISTWDGDVYHVSGLLSSGERNDAPGQLKWRRIASGLFQPLGVKIVDQTIYVTCRDQLVILRDRNNDGGVDHYQCFNNDHQVTEHFHEFAMGLQRDDAGNFYYAKSARHALTAIVPHHGTLLKVSPDGAKTEIVAFGFRAANGVCLNPDGTFIVTDQEGHWNPKNRINWVTPGGFYGNMYGYHDVTDESDDAMNPPLCWITNSFDRSPAELLWVESPRWGNLNGTLLNLSYGYGKIYTVPHQKLSQSLVQGGMCQLPIPQFPTGTMRGRFNPADGHLYICGLFAWGSSQQAKEGGLYRIRYTGEGATMPVKFSAVGDTLSVTFSDPIAPESLHNENSFALKTWSLKRTKNYGSKHYDELDKTITGVQLSGDGKTVTLTIADLEPTWCYELKCRLNRASDASSIERVVHGTIHQL